jgi:hypothetical protein
MGRQLVLRSSGLGFLIGSAVATIGLLRPEPNILLMLSLALLVGVTTGAAVYRRGRGQIPLPDHALLVLFLSMTVFWFWVLLTGYRDMVIEGWRDAAAAIFIVGIPIGGILLVIWNRASTGTHLFDAFAEPSDGP